jgi:hypothetical protein
MAVCPDELSDEAYYELFYSELKEAITPLSWTLALSNYNRFRSFIVTPAWQYEVEAPRYSEVQIFPSNSADSRKILTKIIDEILTKPRS